MKIKKSIMMLVIAILALIVLELVMSRTLDASNTGFWQLHYIPETIGMFLIGVGVAVMPKSWHKVMFSGLLLSMMITIVYVYCSPQWLFFGFFIGAIMFNSILVFGYGIGRFVWRLV